MTVSTTLNKIIYTANGITTAFTFPFPAGAAADIEVFITTSSGTITQLASNVFSVTVNAPIAPNVTGIGGTVNYPLTGSPLAAGNTLTILREVPLTQPDSLANQGTTYQSVIEGALDGVVMQIQDLNELLGRQITVAVSDPTPTALPPAAQRANLIFGFDSAGDPAAVALPSGTVAISAPMIPVVGAASLATARSAMGLGNISTLNVGTGLVSDGTNVNVTAQTQVISINHSITAAQNNNHHFATVALTITFDAASTCFNGWVSYVTALTGAVTLAIDAADSFDGMGVGQSLIIPPGASVRMTTDGTNTWFVSFLNFPNLSSALNLSLVATVGANALTVAVKDANGNDPSFSSPVTLSFRNPTATGGGPIPRAVTSPLSITVPAGATLGTTNASGCRVWVTAFDNSGTIVLGVYVSANYTAFTVKAWDESIATSGTAISAGSTLSQTHYTSSGVTNKSFRVLGCIDITEATAGQWTAAPSRVQLQGVNNYRPGDIIQTQYTASIGGNASVGGTPTASPLAVSILPYYTSSFIKVTGSGSLGNPAGGTAVSQLYSGTAANSFGSVSSVTAAAAITVPASMAGLSYPSSGGAVPYGVMTFAAGGNAVWNTTGQLCNIIAEEVFV